MRVRPKVDSSSTEAAGTLSRLVPSRHSLKSIGLGTAIALAFCLQAASTSAAEPVLDYGFFKSRVEPVFLKKRPNHARCYACHVESNTAFRLERIAAGQKFWSEEQSRRNFETVSKSVVPGKPAESFILLRPLAPEAGGMPFHSGGRQFASKNDPDWKTLAQWVNGQKAPERKSQ